MVPRALSDVQQNLSQAMTALQAEVLDLRGQISTLEAEVEAAAVAHSHSMCLAPQHPEEPLRLPDLSSSRNASSAAQEELLQEVALQPVSAAAGVAHQGTDLQFIAMDIAALKAAVERSSRREFGLVRSPSWECLGIGPECCCRRMQACTAESPSPCPE